LHSTELVASVASLVRPESFVETSRDRARAEKRANAPNIGDSSTFLGRKVGAVFMRVNAKCAHQVRPPPGQIKGC